MNGEIMSEDELVGEDRRKLFSGMQTRVIRTVETKLPILSKDTRDALAISITNEIRAYLSEVFT